MEERIRGFVSDIFTWKAYLISKTEYGKTARYRSGAHRQVKVQIKI